MMGVLFFYTKTLCMYCICIGGHKGRPLISAIKSKHANQPNNLLFCLDDCLQIPCHGFVGGGGGWSAKKATIACHKT